MDTFIDSMPKAELHVHLEGTLEPDLSFALAHKNGIALPYESPEALLRAYDFHDLSSFLAIYYKGMSVLKDEADFFEPQAHTSRGVPLDTVIRGIRRAQDKAAADLGVETQLILCFLRDMSAESAMQTLLQALPYKHWLIGVGLDSDEKNNPPLKFADVFKRARNEGLKLTMHCDVNQKNTLVHIGQVLHDIRVDRIDHGVNSLEDPALCAVIKERGLGLTVCPVSNRFCTQDLTAGHIRRMLHLGMRATVNSDDPAYFRAYMNENLRALHDEGNLSRDEIVQLVRNGFEVAWLDDARRSVYLERLRQHVSRVQMT